jgi:hypothetical protein
VKQRRQERAGADQVAGGDKIVLLAPARSCLTSVAICSAPPASTAIFLLLSLGSAILIPPGGG